MLKGGKQIAWQWLTAALLLFILSGCVTSKATRPDQLKKQTSLGDLYGSSGTAFSPDGLRVAIGTRRMVFVSDVNTGQAISRLPYQGNSRFSGNKSLVFIDNERLLTASNGSILLWDTTKGLVVEKLELPLDSDDPHVLAWCQATQTLAFSLSINLQTLYLATLSENGFGPVKKLTGFNSTTGDIQFSRDGRYIAAAGNAEGVVIAETASGQIAGTLPTEGYVNELALYGERQLMVAGAEISTWTFLGEEQLLELENPDLDGQVSGQVATRVAGSLALGVLGVLAGAISGDPSGVMAAIDVANHPVSVEQQPWCGRSTAIRPDGKLIADVYPGITREVIQVYELGEKIRTRRLNPRGEFSCSVNFSPDGKLLLITSDKAASLYDTASWNRRSLELN